MSAPTSTEIAMMISVIMPAYKMGKFIGSALESVGKQTFRNWEIIVVDDCAPDDGTSTIVRNFADSNPEHRIEFIRHEKNKGVSGARNTAMSASRGGLIAFLDPDDSWKPTYLEQMQHALVDADICACGATRVDESGQLLGSYIYGPTAKRIDEFPHSLARSNFFNPSFTVIRRKVYEMIGGYDEASAIQHAEDWDYWLRALASGFRFKFIENELCLYREHGGAATSNSLRIMEVCTECLRRNIPRFHGAFRKILKDTLYKNLLSLAHVRKNQHGHGWLPAILEAIGLLPFKMGAYKRFIRLSFTGQ
jgi:teichuronic acid biosynthesis glycosyltransferase TuaG